MKTLFSTDGWAEFSAFLKTAPLLAFDFDGTLSKLVATPSKAVLTVKTRRILEALNRQGGVAILTGRSLADIRPLLGFRPRYLVGNHGLEGSKKNAPLLKVHRQICRGWKETLLPLLSAEKGVVLEDKTFSLTLHFRRARAQRATEKKLRTLARRLSPAPRVVRGKLILNLIPASGPHKGDTLVEIMKMAKSRTAFYMGDDETDEDVFRLRQKRIFTVCVGPKRKSAARYYVKGQPHVVAVLTRIAELRSEWEKGLR